MNYSSWDIECDRLKLVIMGHCLPCYPPLKTQKVRILKKWEKIAGDIIILHMYTKSHNHNHMRYSSWIMITWCKLPEIGSEKIPGDIIILHMCTINENHTMYGSWDMEHHRQIFLILDYFLPFYPRSNPENQNFEKMKNTSGDIIILPKCTINDNQLIW